MEIPVYCQCGKKLDAEYGSVRVGRYPMEGMIVEPCPSCIEEAEIRGRDNQQAEDYLKAEGGE